MGLKPAEFWELTPAELNAMIEGYGKRRLLHEEDIIYSAWLTAALQRKKKLPNIKAFIGGPDTREDARTPEERKAELEELKREIGVDQ